MSNLNFNPAPSTTPFFMSDKFASFIVGPYGSAKTTVGLMKIAYEAARVAKCQDGIRRSRCAVVRNTRQMLWDTTIPDFLKWFPDGDAGILEKTNSKFLLKFGDVECEILFRGLDDANDVRRLLSLQLTFGVMDEFREIHPDIYEALAGRVGRYPDKVLVPARPEWGVDSKSNPIGGCVHDDGSAAKRIWGMSNPPDMDTFWEKLLTEPPENVHVTLQPSGVSPEADWIHLLDSGYYENLMELHAADPDWVDVYVHSRFGKSLSGRPVFRSFNPDYHVAKGPLTPIVSENHPLIIGMDFGLTPACTINQQDARGRFLTFAELVSDGMGALRFCRELLRPMLTNRFPGHPVIIIGDPAGAQRAQTDEKTVFDILRAEGFTVVPAKTNAISARISAVEALLSGQVDTGARHLIDPSCKKLIAGMRGGYRYKVRTNGELEDKPDKNSYSHLCFAPGTLIATTRGEIPIELVTADDYALTPFGPRRVLHAWQSNASTHTRTYLFSNGATLQATPDHPVYAENANGFIPIDEIQYTDILMGINPNKEIPCDPVNTQSRSSAVSGTTTNPADTTKRTTLNTEKRDICTAMYGGTHTETSQTDSAYTTKTTTGVTTHLKIWRLCRFLRTLRTTLLCVSQKVRSDFPNISNSLRRWQNSGTPLQRGALGTANTVNEAGPSENQRPVPAPNANRHTNPTGEPPNGDFARQPARALRDEPVGSTTHNDRVVYVAASLLRTSTLRSKRVVNLVGKSQLLQVSEVYALQVDGVPMYFANGVLVKNCDGHQYACLHVDATFGGRMERRRDRIEIKPALAAGWT